MRKIVLHNESNPEDNAMLQALYSRSASSVTDHLKTLENAGSGKFMEKYYVGYGHNSIADCGQVTVYIEGVSMLCAKAIQDHPLYNGQESSSRYIDWSNQPFYNPYSEDPKLSQVAQGLLDIMRVFYVTQKPILIDHLIEQYPIKDGETPSVYKKAIEARAFDILRGFLPCGATTNLSFNVSLRVASEHLQNLHLHPLPEVQQVAKDVHAVLREAYPKSISPLLDPDLVDPYVKHPLNFYDFNPSENNLPYFNNNIFEPTHVRDACVEVYESDSFIQPIMAEIPPRPKRAPFLKHFGYSRCNVRVGFSLDFGSFRDLQRHRGGYCSMPVVSTMHGFHSWYHSQLPISSQKVSEVLLSSISELIPKVSTRLDVLLNQYLLPLGTIITGDLVCDVRQAVYIAELRSGQTVHPTLRPLAIQIGEGLEDDLVGDGLDKPELKVYYDNSPDTWSIRRGTQDISKI